MEVQWLGFCASIAGEMSLIPGQRIRFYMPCMQKKERKKEKEEEAISIVTTGVRRQLKLFLSFRKS